MAGEKNAGCNYAKQRTSTFYHVSLCGGKGVKPIMLSSFGKRDEATVFAREIGSALKLPGKDYVGTEPDEDA